MPLLGKEIYNYNKKKEMQIPLFSSKIKAGFPSPADDYIEKNLDLNEFLVKHPSATFFVKVQGDSMINAGIQTGDILIVDRSVEVRNNKVAVVVINGEMTVKRLQKKKDRLLLIPGNDHYPVIEITDEMDFEIWGMVTGVIRTME